MRLNKHALFPGKNWCRFCGSRSMEFGEFPENVTCIDREDGVAERDIRPEPKLRERAFEDWDTILARLTELKALREEAHIVSNCAAMQGREASECNQCETHCLVCAVKKQQSIPSCIYCYSPDGAKACPSKIPPAY